MTKLRGRRATAIVAIATSVALAATACATDAGAEGDDRISVAMMQPPKASMNPFSDDAFKLSRWSVGETLVQLNDELGIDPMLATDWEQVDDLTWTFELREDVVFHDGTAMDAEAVVNTLDRAAAYSPPPRVLNGITIDAEATGEYEVTITTDSLDALLPNRLASPQLSILAASAYLDDGSVTPVGTATGPFVLTDFSSTEATLDRFDDYWGEPAAIAGIDAYFVPDGTARAGSLRAGEVDLAESIPVSQVELLDPAMVNEVLQPRTTFLTLNSASGPFTDPAVRAAARDAIDTDSIVEGVYEGYADPAVGLMGPAIPWAAELRGDVESGIEPAAIEGTPITLATYTDRAELPEIAVRLEQQLEDAGFDVTQDVREYVNIEADLLAGSFDAAIVSRNSLLDMGDPLSFMAQDFTCDGGFNISQLCDPAVDALVDTALGLPIGEERQEATMAVEAAIMQLDVVVPLVHDRVVQGEANTYVDILRDPIERRLITVETHPA